MTKKLTSIALVLAFVVSPYLYPLSTSAQFVVPSSPGGFSGPLIPSGPFGTGMVDTGRSGMCKDGGLLFGPVCLIQEFALVYGLTAATGYTATPQGANSVTIKAWGAAGGSVGNSNSGGSGALVRATFPVSPGVGVSAVVGGGGYGGGQTRFSDPAAGGGGFSKVTLSSGGAVWAGGGGGEGVDAQEDSPYGGNGGGAGGTPNGGNGGGSGGGAGGVDTFAFSGCINSFGPIGSSCTATQTGVYEQGGYGTGNTNGSLTPTYSSGSGGFNGGGGGGGSTPTSGRKGGGGGGGGGHKGGSGGSVVTGDTMGNGGGGGSSFVEVPFLNADYEYLSRNGDSDYSAQLNINGAWTSFQAEGVAKPFQSPTSIGGPGAVLIQFWGPETCANGASDYPTCTEDLPTEGPTLTITASPQNIYLGSPTTLTWTTTGSGVSCMALPPISSGSGSWNGNKIVNGSQSVTPTTSGIKTYEMECWNSVDWVRASAVVGVNQCGNGAVDFPTCSPVPTVSLSASPTSVTLGNSSTLTWTTNDLNAVCSASTASAGAGSWSGSSTGSGSRSVTPTTTGTKYYSVSCSNGVGFSSAQAFVTVTDAVAPPEAGCPPSCPNPDGFTLGADRDVSVTAFSRGSAVSEQINIPINRTGSFTGPVNISVQSIAPALPTSTVMTFSLGGGSFSAAPSVPVTGSSVSFAFSISEQIRGACGMGSCQNYYITLRGTDPSGVLPADILVLRVNQRGVTPVYNEE